MNTPQETWATCINDSDEPVVIDGEAAHPSAFSGSGPRPAKLSIPPRGVVRIRRSYVAKRRTPNGGDLKSIITMLSGGRLKPHGADALAISQRFVDELEEVLLAQAQLAISDGMGVAARPDPAAHERRLAEEAGRRLMAATAYRNAETRQAQPIIEIAEEPPPAK